MLEKSVKNNNLKKGDVVMKGIRLIVFAVLVLSVRNQAYNSAQLELLISTSQCPSGSDLMGAIMPGINLPGVDLTDALLRGAHLEHANLANAILVRADLTGAHFEHANLTGANLTGAIVLGALWDGADLTGAIWADGRTCTAGSIGTCLIN